MDFDEIADRQGWDADSMVMILRGYINSIGRNDGLNEYAADAAKEENGE